MCNITLYPSRFVNLYFSSWIYYFTRGRDDHRAAIDNFSRSNDAFDLPCVITEKGVGDCVSSGCNLAAMFHATVRAVVARMPPRRIYIREKVEEGEGAGNNYRVTSSPI